MGKIIRALRYEKKLKDQCVYKHLDGLKFFYQGKQFKPDKKLSCTLIIMTLVAENYILLTFYNDTLLSSCSSSTVTVIQRQSAR